MKRDPPQSVAAADHGSGCCRSMRGQLIDGTRQVPAGQRFAGPCVPYPLSFCYVDHSVRPSEATPSGHRIGEKQEQS